MDFFSVLFLILTIGTIIFGIYKYYKTDNFFSEKK